MKKEVLLMLVLLIPFASAKCNGVIVCGQKYECGVRDSINPGDFGVECSCPDPDGKIHPLTNVFNSYKNMLNNYLGWIR